MADPPRLLYWDSCVFISLLSKYPDRISTLEAIVDFIENGDGKTKIVTSEMAKVEVAFVGDKPLTPESEQAIDDFWADDSVVELLEFHDQIAKLARHLVRESKSRGVHRMKPLDAIHLASAISFNVTEFHTYNLGDFVWYQGDVKFKICEPYIAQPKLLPF
jgi:predicted nucleic acid-binding protein